MTEEQQYDLKLQLIIAAQEYRDAADQAAEGVALLAGGHAGFSLIQAVRCSHETACALAVRVAELTHTYFKEARCVR